MLFLSSIFSIQQQKNYDGKGTNVFDTNNFDPFLAMQFFNNFDFFVEFNQRDMVLAVAIDAARKILDFYRPSVTEKFSYYSNLFSSLHF